MSIKKKLTWTMMGISVAAVVLTVGSITAYLIYDMHATKLEELKVTATITADRNSASLLFLDDESADKNLKIFAQDPAILAACIYDEDMALFAAYSPDQTAKSLRCPRSGAALAEELPGMLTAHKYILQSGNVAGKVYIVSDTRDIDNFIHKILLISITTMVLVLIGALVATMYFQRAISDPILQLARTAKQITESRDYTLRANTNYADETAILAGAFNDMLTEVRARDYELSRANETLEQKVVERTKELETAMHKAEQASAAKSEFLRNMSHEFRTPLHALISFTSYGIKEHESASREELKEYFEMMQTGANRLSRLVDEVLDLAKMEQGEHLFRMEKQNIGDLARKASESLRSLLQEKKLTLKIEDNEAEAVCDGDKIIQVITNLLSNAIKFTPENSTVTLQIRTTNDEGNSKVELGVVDEGIGIPEEEIDSIFDSFHQSSRTNTGAGGTGLGLAICRNILQAHNGRIWAKNNENGVGAEVRFTFPADGKIGNYKITLAA